MGRRARASIDESGCGHGIVHVRLVIRTVEILAIPASRKVVGNKDSSRTWLGREVRKLCTSVDKSLQAVVAEAGVRFSLGNWAAHRHAEARFEGRDGLLLDIISSQVILGIVDCDPASCPRCQGSIVDHRHAVVGSVGRVFEVHDGSPVVGEVLGHLAGSTGASGAHVPGHSRVEGITTNDVMKMRGGSISRFNDRVKPLDGQRGASEAKTCLGCPSEECKSRSDRE